ncbi:hypothetical protein EYC84_011087 [Monilinia fructicola]|uniref:Protein ZIP4 homolog n=1 Tax=Monilinia fructicola TaxID=38448 RepID=A0A5M9J9Z1_MONFR|nr:hypothetical protein EYC84_011087 [Monilinia fructicola]
MAEDTRAGVARQLLHGRALKDDGRKLHGKGFVDGDVEADGHGRENGNGNGNGNHNRTDVKDKRLRGLLVFAQTLENDLNSLEASLSRDVFNFAFATVNGNGTFKDLESHIATFPTKLSAGARQKAQELDGKATEIWNVGTRLKRSLPEKDDQEIDDDGASSKCWQKRKELKDVLVMVRMFAFLVLDCANECDNPAAYLHIGSGDKNNDKGEKARGNLLRLMKVGIKTGRDCLSMYLSHTWAPERMLEFGNGTLIIMCWTDEQKTDYAVKVLERLAAYSEALLPAYESFGKLEEKAICARLTAEYFVLRTLLAWRQDDMQLAEHMFNKSKASKHLFDHATTESLSDTLYEMGKALLEKGQHALAVKWLERAYEVLNGDELDKLSVDATELRVSIIQTLVKALLHEKTTESIRRARDLVGLLEAELGDRLVVFLLKLELLIEIPNEPFDGLAYSAILNKMTRVMVINPRNLRLFMFHVRKLHEKAPSKACTVLDEMIRLRIKELAVMMEWLEKAILTRIWMTVSGRDTNESSAVTEGFLSIIAENVEKHIGVEATMAAHTLLWKKIEESYGLGQYATAEKWCRLAMHKLFLTPGEENMAKIARKLLLCALGRGEFDCARDVFGSMSDTAKEEPLTRFLMYKIAIRSGDVELAAECLEKVTSCSEDPTLLFACVLDAQKAGNKNIVLDALWMVLDKCGYGAREDVYLPSIIRTIIILLVGVIESEGSPTNKTGENIEKLCKLFEGALHAVQKAQNRELWTILELEWFSKNSYNLSLKHLSVWEPQQSIRMLASCIGFIDCHPQDIGQEAHDDVTLRKMFCNFCAATTFVSIARAEENVEIQLQSYLNLRKHVTSFHHLLQKKLEKLDEEIAEDLLRKFSVLLAFDFEAACRLKDWDGLGEIILRARVFLIMMLKKITNVSWEIEDFDTIKLSKYMRCLFQAALGNDDKIAEELINQVCMLAADAVETDIPYPTQELEWLATKSFNHAIDLYSANQDDVCKRWAEKSIVIAGYCVDGGSLQRFLRERFEGLRFDVKL